MVQKIAYLTIDDAPSEDMGQKVDFLKAKNIPAIFFCQGDFLEARPQAAIDAIHQGFVIGNHAYDHPHFSTLPLEACFEQIQRTDVIVEQIYAEAGVPRPAKIFRFPYGDKGGFAPGGWVFDPYTEEGAHRKNAIQDSLRRLGYFQPRFEGVTYASYRAAGLLDDLDWHWTYDVLEWCLFAKEPLYGLDSLDKILARMDVDAPEAYQGLNDPASEEIILTHDHQQTTAAFFVIVERLLEKGLIFKLPDLAPNGQQ